MKMLLLLSFGGLLMMNTVRMKAINGDELEGLVREFSHHEQGKERPTVNGEGDNDGCCFPDSLQFRPTPDFKENISYYIDLKNSRLAATLSSSPKAFSQRSLLFFGPNKTCIAYDVMEDSKFCNKQKLTNVTIDDFWMRCIPSNATKQPATTLGAEGSASTLVLQPWAFTMHGAEFFMITTGSNCVPVAQGVSYQGNQIVFFVDLATRIKDPSVFDIPPYCDKVLEVEMKDSDVQRLPSFFRNQLQFK